MLLGAAFCAATGIAAIVGATAWFHETPETFAENAGGNWSYAPGVASRVGDKIKVSLVADSRTGAISELQYRPSVPASETCVIGEHLMSFDTPGSMTFNTHGATVGLQIVERTDEQPGFSFAVLDPVQGESAWVDTGVAAETNVTYQIRIEEDCTPYGEVARYSFRLPAATDYTTIAEIPLPSGVTVPDQFVYLGDCSVFDMEFACRPGVTNPYRRWQNAPGIFSWQGGSSTFTSAKVKVFDLESGQDLPTEMTIGTASTEVPGWIGTSTKPSDVFKFAGVSGSKYLAPGHVLRFGVSGKTATLNPAFAHFALGGVIVEAGVTTAYKINSTTNGRSTDLGDNRETGGVDTWFVANENFSLVRNGAMSLWGALNFEVASGKDFKLNNTYTTSNFPTLEPGAAFKMHGDGTVTVAKLVATGAVTLDYSDLAQNRANPFLNGKLDIDPSTVLKFPAWLEEGVPYQLCSGALDIGGGASSAFRTIYIGGVARRVKVTFSGNTLTYVATEYAYEEWVKSPGLFTWAGEGSSFEGGLFAGFDPKSGLPTGRLFEGSESYDDLPGHEGGYVEKFWYLFTRVADTGAVAPSFVDPGYVLRFAPGVGMPGAIAAEFSSLDLGGLIVESGAAGYSLVANTAGRSTSFGDPSGSCPAQIEINENFGIDRGGPVTFRGPVGVRVSGGRVFSVNAGGTEPVVLASGASLSFSGDGQLSCGTLTATGAVTLAYSDLSAARTNPFVDGALKVDAETVFALPAAAKSAGSYKLCTGALSAPTGSAIKPLRFGDETVFATVSFNASAKTIVWSELASCNRATVGSDCRWRDISWSGGAFDYSKPAEITLTADVRIEFDQPVTDILGVLFKGGHTATLVYTKTPVIDVKSVAADSAYEIEIPATTDFPVATAQVVPVGETWVIVGGVASDRTWSGSLQVRGTLKTSGKLALTHAGNAVASGGVLQVLDGALTMNGATGAMKGELTVCDGAVFIPQQARDFLNTQGHSVLKLYGTYDLGSATQSLTAPMQVEFFAGSSVVGVGAPDGCALEFAGLETLSIKAAPGRNAVTVSARVGYRLAEGLKSVTHVDVETGVNLAWNDTASVGVGEGYAFAVTGGGSISLSADAALQFASESFAEGGIRGYGAAIFSGLPESEMLKTSLRSDAWRGTFQLRDAMLADFDPARLGNENSAISLLGCRGYFAKEPGFGPRLVLEKADADYTEALELSTGYDQSKIELARLEGEGKLVVKPNTHAGAYRVFIPSDTAFAGSIEISESGNRNAVIFGAGDEVAKVASFEDFDGQIAVLSGVVTIGANSIWAAENGIRVMESATVNNRGLVRSRVVGSGTIVYSGAVSAAKPEAAARYTDAETWQGTLLIRNAELESVNLVGAGNTNSTVGIEDSLGSLADQVLPFAVKLVGRGLRVTAAAEHAQVVIPKLTGNGSLSLEAESSAEGWAYRVSDISAFEGSVSVTSSKGSLLIGDAELTVGGAIQFASGCTIRSKRNWTARTVTFGDVLYVIGSEGDSIVYLTSGEVSCGHVRVYLAGGMVDPKRRYVLDYDGITKSVYITSTASPPEMTIAASSVVYGVDFTNAQVVVTIADYWGGHDFEGETVAEVYIRDANGRVIGGGSTVIDGDGDYVIGNIELPHGRGHDYRYDISIVTLNTESGEEQEQFGRSIGQSGVHRDADWFDEDAATFLSADPSVKTGDWTYFPGSAVVTNGVDIAINTPGLGQNVRFVPYNDSSNDVVTVETDMVFDNCFDWGFIDEDESTEDRFASLTVVADTETEFPDDNLCYAIWVPDASVEAKGRYIKGWGHGRPTLGVSHRVALTVNHQTGYLSYSVDGSAITNAQGVSCFSYSAVNGGETVRKVGYSGIGSASTLIGEQHNGNLAGYVKNGVTNECATLDEAVAAAVQAGVSNIVLYWDASWRPSVADRDRTFVFDTGDHRLAIDDAAVKELERAGYHLVFNGDGSFTISLQDYAISYDGNGGFGVMPDQVYTVTNMVFNLQSNAFVSAGYDFAGWNTEKDGSGPTNWADGAEIDMRQIGFTNLTLFAQWRVAVRQLTIEAADEFVYVERVTTNGVDLSGVRYYCANAEKATGRVVVSVEQGSELEVRFSTDIEKCLTYWATNVTIAASAMTLPYASLPTIVAQVAAPLATTMEMWAHARGISRTQLRQSNYSRASSLLNVDHLLTEQSVIRIYDFAVTPEGCVFRVEIDGETLGDPALLTPMLRVSSSLGSGWTAPSPSDVSLCPDGRLCIKTGSAASFVKIIIPKND